MSRRILVRPKPPEAAPPEPKPKPAKLTPPQARILAAMRAGKKLFKAVVASSRSGRNGRMTFGYVLADSAEHANYSPEVKEGLLHALKNKGLIAEVPRPEPTFDSLASLVAWSGGDPREAYVLTEVGKKGGGS